jgi:hypothetical protein
LITLAYSIPKPEPKRENPKWSAGEAREDDPRMIS